MTTKNKSQKYRIEHANASTLEWMIRFNQAKRLKQLSKKASDEAIKKPVRKRIGGSVFDDDLGE